MASTSPINPNFWLCLCLPTEATQLHSVFETRCARCEQLESDSPRADQQQINDHADQLHASQQLARQARHQLPEQRKQPVPTRDEFEEALDERDRLRKQILGHPFPSDTEQRQVRKLEFLIARYKAAA